MITRGKCTVVGVVLGLVLALAFGAVSAMAKPSGIIPAFPGHGTELGHRSAGMPSARSPRPGSPSPECDPVNFSCEPPLLYGGGPVMHAVTTHVIAWDPSSAASFPNGYVSGYEGYLSDLAQSLGASSNVSSVAQQYVDAGGPALSSLTNSPAIIDTDGYPASGCDDPGASASACLTEEQIMAELTTLIANDALAANMDQSYIVLLPPQVNTCIDSSSIACESNDFCGYHDVLNVGSATTTFSVLAYTESSFSDCYDGSSYPAGTPTDLGALESLGTHELLESATDPTATEPGYAAGYLDVNGWEIGDECAYYYDPATATGSGDYNQVDNLHQYLIQDMWSNQDNSCAVGDGTPATATITPSGDAVVNKPASFSVSTTGIGTASTYAWSYLAPGSVTPASAGSNATEQITFSTPGVYQVWAQVADSSADSVTGVRSVTVYGLPTAGFGFSTQTPTEAVGVPVSFNSASTSGFGSPSITSATWNFGDGASGSGNSVSHTYAAAGNYTVTLSVAQTHGETASVSHSVTVSNAPTAAFAVPVGVTAGAAATFSSSSTAGAGALTDVTWNFGDGSSSSGSPVSHTYASAGNYTVTLTVTQADGLSTSVQHTVTVAASGLSASNVANAARRLLRTALTPSSKATNIARLLKTGSVTIVIPAPIESGRVTIIWHVTIHHKQVVVARGSRRVIAGSRARIVVRLTAAGRRLLRKSRTLKVTASGLYRYGSSGVIVNKTIRLHH